MTHTQSIKRALEKAGFVFLRGGVGAQGSRAQAARQDRPGCGRGCGRCGTGEERVAA